MNTIRKTKRNHSIGQHGVLEKEAEETSVGESPYEDESAPNSEKPHSITSVLPLAGLTLLLIGFSIYIFK